MTRERAVTNVTAGVVLLLGALLFVGGTIRIVGDLRDDAGSPVPHALLLLLVAVAMWRAVAKARQGD